MEILIGTPIHESKDYSMERWLKSVSALEYPADLLMVDNSPDNSYTKKVLGYCKKYKINNYKIAHIDKSSSLNRDERFAQSRETIRKEVLQKGYDAWYSLECDVIVPPDALTKLVNLIDDNWMVRHGYPGRDNPESFNSEFGTSLIRREALEKYSFMGGFGYCDPLEPQSWYEGDVWFIKRLNRDTSCKKININGIIRPIYHLAK